MLLDIDIGNTNIVIGLHQGQELRAHWRLSSTITRTDDECWILLKLLCESEKLSVEEITGAIISSVVPNLTPVFVKMAQRHLQLSPIVVDAEIDTGIKILYDTPKTVGADRICNAVAGFHKYGGPLIVVDFGTATTFDVVTQQGEYLGGIIAPGIETSAYVLHRYAAKLPKVELKFPDSLIGRSTESSIQSGLMYGAVEMVDGLIERLVAEMGPKTKVIATGGLASLILPESKRITIVEPFLTLEGLKYIYERVTSQQLKSGC
ncbi:MAG: type III pantothenate kinase [candidate division KSB1 bacterium]|nr:type III pantothenate kinase [candidate division KSB1 bacterium]